LEREKYSVNAKCVNDVFLLQFISKEPKRL
jgi:hypothetical protein